MSFADLKFCQKYFRETEKRPPTITELRVIDTYWSDHCRHTTFNTAIDEIIFEAEEKDATYYMPALMNAYKLSPDQAMDVLEIPSERRYRYMIRLNGSKE